MKILQINSVCGIGSTGRIATDIHQMLLKQGHESYIAFGRGEPRNCDTAIRIGSKIDVYSHVVLTRAFDRHGFGSKNATKEFIKRVKEINPDVIHLHNIHGYYINIEILFDYLKESNKPVVWTLHDCWAFTGHCAYFDYVGCEKWKNGCHNCPEKSAYPESYLLDNSASNYSLKKDYFDGINNLTIVTPSIWLSNLVKESFLGNYKTVVINNGIDLNVFKPTDSDFRVKYNIRDKFIILGVASVWERRKGLKYFFELNSFLRDDEIIVLIGLSKKQLLTLPKGVIGIARTENIKELAGVYSTSDVFINPTLEDNYPTTNLEAIACKTPIITFNTGGSVECINGDNGFITSTKSTIAIREKINTLRSQNTNHHLSKDYSSEFASLKKLNQYIEYYGIISKGSNL